MICCMVFMRLRRKYTNRRTDAGNNHKNGKACSLQAPLINVFMEKRVLGIILALVGVVGLILAGANFLNGSGTRDLKQIVVYGVLGAIFFFAGIGLIRNTRDKPS